MQCRNIKTDEGGKGQVIDLGLAEIRKHGVDELKRLVDLLTNLGLR